MAGSFPDSWIHGSPNCAASTDPPVQVHAFDADTYILRQNKCVEPATSFEGPFLYLLFGEDRALLLDTGATSAPQRFPIWATVQGIVAQWLEVRGRTTLPLVVCHSHSHGDHTAGDAQFAGRPGVTVVAPTLSAVRTFFSLDNWPEQTGTFALGQRTLTVIPTPGHEVAHLALYDPRAQLLLTGDTLYPGLLVVHDWEAYRRSVARLTTLAREQPVSFVLGAHVEMKAHPREWFGYPALYQPGEHVLQLTTRHLEELNAAVVALGEVPQTQRHDDFIIQPAWLPVPPADA
jgi:glyoxylase-like metal-dependent hydrolase (beta-lactamase superfamily II)